MILRLRYARQAYNDFYAIKELGGEMQEKYASEVEKQLDLVTKTLYRIFQDLPPEAHTQMERLRERRRSIVDQTMRSNMQKLNYQLDQASSIVAISGDDRLEWVGFVPWIQLRSSGLYFL